MQGQHSPITVPHRMREGVIAGDGFIPYMRERGWSVADCRPIYTDREVIRQPWLDCPSGARYTDRAFYHLFGYTSFRKLLRVVLLNAVCTEADFVSICPNASERDRYLTFLLDQEFLREEGRLWRRGPRLFSITNIGHTLEWYVAEWFRLNRSQTRLARVRHGVTLHRLLDLGDVDVVALLEPWTVIVECKSSPEISDRECSLFLRRARYVHPDLSILLIDTPSLALDSYIRSLNKILAAKQEQDFITPVPAAPGVYWGATYIYVTGVSESLGASLELVLHIHEER